MTKDSRRPPPITVEEAAELRRARDRMIARDRLIDEMVDNNEMQIKNEHARGGAEIELACAVRGAARAESGSDAHAELERAISRLEMLREEHRRLVAEREWLNTSLREIDNGPSSGEHQRSGHA
ncbi:hypothetical protein ACVIGB_008983 [Bradyrhizobium sp. USDA 4341]|uniref:Uncharacterized protein n=1 Tax=Bradyrhizobium erythrophlei TaxID=1437360 RepID=A0A1H5HQL0_9BRAD|nr:hypothetical protein [Bradyrhizobium erythrophlei]SEE29608.1 hypothetical protein SAMN05444164_7572 [Bradyrhizobium erythrophlei]